MRKWPQFLAKASALFHPSVYASPAAAKVQVLEEGVMQWHQLSDTAPETMNAPFVMMLMVAVVVLYHAIFHFLIIAQFYTEIRLAKTGRKAICAWRMTARNICNFILGL